MQEFDRATTVLPSPFYRVTVKALVMNDKQQLLVGVNKKGAYELPGGGWEHGETLEECLARELQEEFGVRVMRIGQPICFWAHPHRDWQYWLLRIGVPVRLKDDTFTPGDGLVKAQFVSQDEFIRLNLETYEGNVKDQIDKIWSMKE
ncbi:NUDIX hydrolase [Candidatus Saccharibacteria bacterium]|nr:NUDIX hydrolase [Candidatus Saccharibacteria bacterium]HPR09883.1 NUDIX hydrolase [Candidatus Saccharibacteria bacterium]